MADVDIEAGWAELMTTLGRTLDDLSEGQRVLLASEQRPYLVSAARRAGSLLRIEAVSNGHLEPQHRLDVEGIDLLGDLGWQPPTHFPDDVGVPLDGSTNHFMDIAGGWQGAVVASIMVRTVRGAYDLAAPGQLHVHRDIERSLPTERWPRRQPPRPAGRSLRKPDPVSFELAATGLEERWHTDVVLRDIVDGVSSVAEVTTVQLALGADDLVCIVAERGDLTVYYDAGSQLARIVLMVEHDLKITTESLLAVIGCSRSMGVGRLELRGSSVVALLDLPVVGPVGHRLVDQLESLLLGRLVQRAALARFASRGAT